MPVRIRGRLAIATGVVVWVLLGAAPAQASTTTVDNSGGVITITGTSGAQGIVIHHCDTFARGHENICVTDRNACSTEFPQCVTPSGNCLTLEMPDQSFEYQTAECGHDATQINASLQGFDDILDNRTAISMVADGGNGDDTILGSSSNDTLSGGDDNDELQGEGGNDTLSGDAGDDSLLGGHGSDRLVGGAGADTFDGGEDSDNQDIDIADYSAESTGFSVTIGSGRNDGPGGTDDVQNNVEGVIGGSGADTLVGDGANNILDGRAGVDSLHGGIGNDLLIGGSGAENDSLAGDDGNDTVSYANRTAGVTASIGTSGGQTGETDTYVSVENFLGGSGNDAVTGSGAANSLAGGAGNDTLTGGRGNDSLEGGTGDDTLNGEADADSVDGGAGNDTLQGGAGDDTFTGDAGTDTINGGTERDSITYEGRAGPVFISLTGSASGEGVDATGAPNGAEGDRISFVEDAVGSPASDILIGTSGANLLTGGDGNDFFLGASGNDTIDGNAGDDLIVPGAGSDVAFGGDGDDEFDNDDTGPDSYNGGSGQDEISYRTGSQPVTVDLQAGTGGVAGESDTFVSIGDATGGGGNDILRGDDVGNTLSGGDGEDQLFGRGGPDTLLGGLGKDELDGGTGDDVLNGGSPGEKNIVDYSERTNPVTVDLGAGTGGEAGEHDTLIAIQNVWGGSVDDTLKGDDQDNVLYGNAGNDTISTGAGNDKLIGGAGVDSLDAGANDDQVDALDDVADAIVCGDGADALAADPHDPLPADCETQTVVDPNAPPPATSPPPGAVLPPAPGSPGSVGPAAVGGGVENGQFAGVQIGTENPGAPSVSGFRASPARFALGPKSTPPRVITAVARGTKFSFSVNEKGTARIDLRFLPPKKRAKAAGTLVRSAVKGRNTIAFSGRLGKRKLKPGRYRATLSFTDPSGLAARRATTAFTIVAAR